MVNIAQSGFTKLNSALEKKVYFPAMMMTRATLKGIQRRPGDNSDGRNWFCTLQKLYACNSVDTYHVKSAEGEEVKDSYPKQ